MVGVLRLLRRRPDERGARRWPRWSPQASSRIRKRLDERGARLGPGGHLAARPGSRPGSASARLGLVAHLALRPGSQARRAGAPQRSGKSQSMGCGRLVAVRAPFGRWPASRQGWEKSVPSPRFLPPLMTARPGGRADAKRSALQRHWLWTTLGFVRVFEYDEGMSRPASSATRIAAIRAEASAVGAELAAHGAAMDPDELFEVTGDLQGVANAVEGAQLVAIAHAGSHELRLTDRGPVAGAPPGRVHRRDDLHRGVPGHRGRAVGRRAQGRPGLAPWPGGSPSSWPRS